MSEFLAASLADDGFVLTAFSIGDVDLGRSGEVIQATVRARLELHASSPRRRLDVRRSKRTCNSCPCWVTRR